MFRRTGQVVLPAEIWSKLGLNEMDYLDVLYEGDTVFLKKNRAYTCCSECGKSGAPLAEVGKILICEGCEAKIKQL